MSSPLISIITASYNAEKYINDCISSILQQRNKSQFEYIIKDGNSSDSTIKVISQFQDSIQKVISNMDFGLYDALNQGIKEAKGNYIGILNADDILKQPTTLSNIEVYLQKHSPDCLLGDVEIVDQNNLQKVRRKYSAKNWSPSLFKYGIMPPHPAVYIKRELFEKYGYYKLDYKIAADYELLVRFLWKHKVSYAYLPETVVTMRDGGISNQGFFKSKRLITKEIMKACKENGLKTNTFLLNLRYLMKLKQLI
jgi:glycosyltransferase involved in cell wall biosynthesis